MSVSPTSHEDYGHGDVVDGDLGAPPAGVGQEGLSEDVTSRLSAGAAAPWEGVHEEGVAAVKAWAASQNHGYQHWKRQRGGQRQQAWAPTFQTHVPLTVCLKVMRNQTCSRHVLLG